MSLNEEHVEIASKILNAMGWGNLELLIKYFDAGWEDIYNQHQHGLYPMIWFSVYYIQYDILKFLIERGYSIDFYSNQTLLHLAVSTGYEIYKDQAIGHEWDGLEKAINDHFNIIKLLIDQGLKVSAKDNEGRDVFEYYCLHSYTDDKTYDLLKFTLEKELAELSFSSS
jgi:hypothetical protein